ncbi:MAG: abortive infection family protein [Bifidobacteriales bacterium]|uniref:abortive infection family protein n=1 Tax=Apilactobacillus kunkeei TaxID=148814 RepID=UPI002DDCCE9E|nr:abortive infection family protein [Bifidobacteriales bacterium]
MEDSLYEALNQKKIIDLFIEGNDYFSRLSIIDIIGLHKEFGNLKYNGVYMSRNQAMSDFFNYIHKNSKTLKFLNYYILKSDIKEAVNLVYWSVNQIDDIYSDDARNYSEFPEEICNINFWNDENEEKIKSYIRDSFINKINDHLFSYDLKIIREGDIITSNKESDFSLISSDIEIDDDLRTLIDKAKESLKSEDYASVMTKSKSIVEAEFKNILKRKNVDYSDFSKNFNNLRSAVNAQLGMVKQGSWEKHAKQLVKGINITFDTLLDLRNSFSDSHGGNDYSKIKKAEATLALNAAVSLSEYYENIYERQQKKLS